MTTPLKKGDIVTVKGQPGQLYRIVTFSGPNSIYCWALPINSNLVEFLLTNSLIKSV